jgi:hypothetical protein
MQIIKMSGEASLTTGNTKVEEKLREKNLR